MRAHIAVVGCALALAGCKTFSPDGGMDLVAGIAANELKKDVVAIRSDSDALLAREQVERQLKRPLSADAAVQVALLNNRGLQAAYNELGIAEAQMVEASLPPNPKVSIERLSSAAEIEVEKRIIANILALVTLPARADIAADRFRQAQLRAAEETLRLAADTRRAYYRAVAAYQLASFLSQAKDAAEAATKLAQRLGETGALNKLDQAREQVFYAEITAQLARARRLASGERERLTRLMGLWGHDLDYKLPGTLPALPVSPKALPDVEYEAVARRVDLQIARIGVVALGKSLSLTEATRFVNLIELSGIRQTKRERESGEREIARGFELELQLPIFDGGEVRVRQAVETYSQALNHLAERAVNVRSEARDAYRTYRSSYDIAGHYRREVLPLRKIIVDEALLRYNAMQIDVFALLNETRQRINAISAGIEAQRDFWLSAVDLNVAIVGGGALRGPGESARPVAASEAEPGVH